MLIEKHIIWNDLCKTYGIQDLLDLKENYTNHFSYPIMKNIQHRLIHLRSRFEVLQSLVNVNDNQTIEQNPNDQNLINDVANLCMQLENLTQRLKRTQEQMEHYGTMVETCVEKYKKSMKNFDRLCNTSSENEQIRQNFRMDALDNLSCEQNVASIDDFLQDIDFRERCLLGSKQIRSSSQSTSSDDTIDKIDQKLKKLSDIKDELHRLQGHLRSLKDYINEYDELLRDEQLADIPCSKFILLLERMRVRTEEFEIFNNFPETDALMRTWMNDHSTGDEFNPKVIKLCQALEIDIQHLFQDFNWIYSLSYKIGIIGHGSVGKSALTMNLAELNTFSAMIDFERSTFGYLQFDTRSYKDPDNDKIIPITFIDIEGATDVDQRESAGNYLQLIKKADCDLYIIVFDNLFNEHNRICQNYIENELKRQCLSVRSKADVLFNQCFRDSYSENYERTRSSEYRTKVVLSQIKNHVLKTFDDQRLSKKVYLTAVVCEDNVKGGFFAEFDLQVLKNKLIRFAKTDIRAERICNLAIRSAIKVINTCFRRGYVVSQTKYKWLSAGASIIPLLSELPAFLGREKIRQVFGIHDNATVTNLIYRTKNSLEEYLKERKLTVPEEELKSGDFQYLIPSTTTATNSQGKSDTDNSASSRTTSDRKQMPNWLSRILENIARPIGAASIMAITLADDIAAVGLRTVSKVGITAVVLLSPIFAVWSFYSTGRGMNTELHSICDDLAVILQYFIVNRCEESGQNIQIPVTESPNEDSSSSNSEDD